MAPTPISPLDILKMRFPQKMRGYDTSEVESFLKLVADQLADRLSEAERAQTESREVRLRLQEMELRQAELQNALLRAQRVSEEIVANAKREAEVMVREAEVTGDRIVNQAVEQATRIEAKIVELRTARREVQLRLRNTLELYSRILEADMQDDQSTATVHTLPRIRRQS
jgi:cell division initiation protein